MKKEAAELNKKQSEAMASFTALAKEIQQLKDPTKLKEKTHELQKLRHQIDQLAPQVFAKSQQAKESNRGGKSCAAQDENDHEIGGIGREQAGNCRGTNN